MRVSINVSNHAYAGSRLTEELGSLARAADEAGLHTLWIPDHLIQADPNAGDDRDVLEAYTVLGYLAATTSRVRLGTLVSAVSIRPPALLIKAVTTLDVLSQGRAWLGIGAGYHEREAAAMGLPLPPVRERFDNLEDTLRLAKRLWAGDETPFRGLRHRLDAPELHPAAASRPHPPILVGGSGERRTLPLVARYADAANLFDIPDGGATIRRKIAVLDDACRRAGRDPAEIERTVCTRIAPGQTVEEFVRHCESLAGLGIGHVIVNSGPPWTATAVHELAPVVDALAARQ